jgi:formate hydrogenlyase subunit 3/multisubunit Na+/H+ antiporter MnhD subunit
VAALLLGIGLLVGGGCAALLARRSVRWTTFLGVGGAIAGCLAGLIPAGRVLLGGAAPSLRMAWDVPYGAFFVQVDALSALFLLPIFGLSALAALYGAEYMAAHGDGRAPATTCFFFNLLVASMALVVVARNAVLFLVAWELMALASFFLVTHEDDDERVRDAGWTYLIATHLGTAWLLALFILLGRGADSLDFDRFGPASGAGLLFLLAVVGFGTKAGFVPFHVWLPEAHPAAPSHVSAVMSGVMITTGLYGLVRTVTFLGPLPVWAGWVLIAVGVTSGALGVLLAIAQHDLKRLLAYSSVENVGIVALGLGLGLVGVQAGSAPLAVLGFGGGLLHVVNHALFKGLLFLGAGAVVRAAGTRDIDALGGLLKRMPRTGLAFLVGAAAISGLPFLNGFVGELLIYMGALGAATSPGSAGTVPALVVIAALALMGGLAVACFTKAFGVIFLGEPRSEHAARARDPGLAMQIPMQILAAACLLVGVCSPVLIGLLAPVLVQVTGLPMDAVQAEVTRMAHTLGWLVACAAGFLGLVALTAGLRRWLLSGRSVTAAVTWDCGYAQPSPRMQYTGSSFAQPLTELFEPLLGTRRRLSPPEGFFPSAAAFASETADPFREHLYRPAFAGIERSLSAFRWLQHGRVQLYVLYIALTLLAVLLWRLGEA